jgi:integrase/recombinase XerD
MLPLPQPPHTRNRTVARLEQSEVQRLIQTTYRSRSKYGLMIKTLFQTGARVDEFVHIRVEDLLLDGDPPQIHMVHAKRGADRYVPILPALADELRTHLHGRQTGFLFESNRQTRYSTRTVQSIVTTCARTAGIKKRVYPHLLRHSIATILLDSGLVPIDQYRSSWDTLTFQLRRFMPKLACGPWATITPVPWAGCGSSTCRNLGLR